MEVRWPWLSNHVLCLAWGYCWLFVIIDGEGKGRGSELVKVGYFFTNCIWRRQCDKQSMMGKYNRIISNYRSYSRIIENVQPSLTCLTNTVCTVIINQIRKLELEGCRLY